MPESRLYDAAERAEAACDLEVGLPGAADRLAAETVAALDALDPARASPRAMWNLLWLAADLTAHVDIYRATQLFDAVERLFTTRLQAALTPGPLADAAEMAFDLFFHREAPPLASARFDRSLAALARVLQLDNLHCRRAALHGLGLLRAHAPSPAGRAAVDALLGTITDRALRPLAALARSGELF